MSIQSRYLHTLVIKRLVAGVNVDEYGQPVSAVTTVATVPGLIQPRRAREVALASQEGVVVGDYVGYMDVLIGLDTDCWIEHGGARYDLISMPDAAGLGHHLELGLRRVD